MTTPDNPPAARLTLRDVLKGVPEGPYFISHDDGSVDDFLAHKGSGLAIVDTGRSGDWPITHFAEWPTARLIARCTPKAMRAVLSALEPIAADHAQTADSGAGLVNRPQGPCSCKVCTALKILNTPANEQ